MCLDYDETIIGTEGSSMQAALNIDQVVIMSEEKLCGECCLKYTNIVTLFVRYLLTKAKSKSNTTTLYRRVYSSETNFYCLTDFALLFEECRLQFYFHLSWEHCCCLVFAEGVPSAENSKTEMKSLH